MNVALLAASFAARHQATTAVVEEQQHAVDNLDMPVNSDPHWVVEAALGSL